MKKQHFVVNAIMKPHLHECLCPVGAVCAKEELSAALKAKGVIRYKVKSIDSEPVEGWEKADWVTT